MDAPDAVLTARAAARNQDLPDGAPRIDPALVAFGDARIERPEAEELALFDPPSTPGAPGKDFVAQDPRWLPGGP